MVIPPGDESKRIFVVPLWIFVIFVFQTMELRFDEASNRRSVRIGLRRLISL